MKLKFRADPEDLTIFGIFAVFLLYIVAIGVLNLNSFATEGYLHGLNPFPAFTPRFIAATLTFYVLVLVGLFVLLFGRIVVRCFGLVFVLFPR